MKGIHATILVLLALLVTREAGAGALDLPVKRHHLANGLRLILAPDAALADVTVLVRYDVGHADDPNGLEGLAHLVEHLQFAGTRHVGAGDHARLLEAAGGTGIIGHTALDYTIYGESVPRQALALALWLESDRMGFGGESIDEARVARERNILSHEYESRVADSQSGPVGQFMRDEIFPAWHPYHVPDHFFGVSPSITLRDVKAFRRTWYSPANATVILVGPFEQDAGLALVSKYFESLPSATPPPRPRLPAFRTGDVVSYASAMVLRTQIVAAWQTPALREPGDRELDIVARLLNGPNGILVRDLVDHGLATGVTARQNSLRRGSAFMVRVEVADGGDIASIGNVIEQAIAGLANRIDEQEITRARKDWTDNELLTLETPYGRAIRLSTTGDLEDPWDLDAYQHITSTAVSSAVARFLVPQSRVAAVIYPATKALPPHERLLVEHRDKRLQ